MGYGGVAPGQIVLIVGKGHPFARFLAQHAGEAILIIDIAPEKVCHGKSKFTRICTRINLVKHSQLH